MTDTLERARRLRKAVTPAEKRAWWLLRNRQLCGFKFRRQHPIGRYVVDFYSCDARLAVEFEGGVHGQPSQAAKDTARAAFLQRRGIRVLRVPNAMVMEDPETFLRKVREAAMQDPHPSVG